MSEPKTPPSPAHPCEIAWDALVTANEALDAARAALATTAYRVAMLTTYHRAVIYTRELGLLLEELGEQ